MSPQTRYSSINEAWMHTASKQRPLILAHRGAMDEAPQNTMAAFDLAIEQGADGFELDVQLSKDGVMAIFHDDTLEALSNGHGRIGDHTWADLQKLDVGSHFSPSFRGARMPSLEELLERHGTSAVFNIELKFPEPRSDMRRVFLNLLGMKPKILRSTLGEWKTLTEPLVLALIRMLRDSGLIERVVVSSFNPVAIQLCEEIEPTLARAFLYSPDVVGDTEKVAATIKLAAWHPYHKLIKSKTIQEYHRAGIRVQAWTVNKPERAQQLASWGIDGIITNRPALIRNAIEKK